ncbi:hypothetical protein FOL46_004584 [Perkinsus olseni]|uniref:Uncharacterized protein n=1 Tax=Perkinsus olseni TaxID=32597 RepID=A0A7J6MSS0_PEROL|nr:hypothetical protein FOL46_004584 [Perkinsus olseni]
MFDYLLGVELDKTLAPTHPPLECIVSRCLFWGTSRDNGFEGSFARPCGTFIADLWCGRLIKQREIITRRGGTFLWQLFYPSKHTILAA